MVDWAGHQTGARVARESLSNPRVLRTDHDSPSTACRTRGPTDPSPTYPGDLVVTTGPRTRAAVTPDSWSTPRDLVHGPERESTGTAG